MYTEEVEVGYEEQDINLKTYEHDEAEPAAEVSVVDQSYDEPSKSKRYFFSTADDIALVKQANAKRAYAVERGKSDEAWKSVARSLKEDAALTATFRSLRDRFKLLLQQYRSEDGPNRRKSGKAEQYDELKQLLQRASDIEEEFKRSKVKSVSAEAEQQKITPLKIRDAPMRGMLKPGPNSSSSQPATPKPNTTQQKRPRKPESEKTFEDAADADGAAEILANTSPIEPAKQMSKRAKQNAFSIVVEKEWRKKAEVENERLKLQNEKLKVELQKEKLALERERIQLDQRRFDMEMKDREEQRKAQAEKEQNQNAFFLEALRLLKDK